MDKWCHRGSGFFSSFSSVIIRELVSSSCLWPQGFKMAATVPSIRFSHKNIYNKNEEAKKNIHHSHLSSFMDKNLSQKCTTGFFLFLVGHTVGPMDWGWHAWYRPNKISWKMKYCCLNKLIVLLPRKRETCCGMSSQQCLPTGNQRNVWQI